MATPFAETKDEKAADEQPGRLLPAIRRIKLPKSLVFTVVGALLTLWVLPAFARQFDDQQKARELQSSLIEEIAVASSEADAAATAATSGADGTAAWDKWQVEQNKVDARLRAYFDADVVDEWARYGDAESSMLAIAGIDSDYVDPWVVKPLPASAAIVIQSHIETLLKAPGTGQWTRERIDDFTGPDPALRGLAITYAQDDLAESRSIITASILAASPRGYSISRGDLLSDLLP
jgi:hypothetical protein